MLSTYLPREPKTYKNVLHKKKTWFLWKPIGKTWFFQKTCIYPLDYCIEPPFMSYNKIHIIFMSFLLLLNVIMMTYHITRHLHPNH